MKTFNEETIKVDLMNQKCFSLLANYRVPRISFDICNLENTDLLSPPALKENLLHSKTLENAHLGGGRFDLDSVRKSLGSDGLDAEDIILN